MNRAYITHITRDYLDVSINLARSIQSFSNIPLIIFCIKLGEYDRDRFSVFPNVLLRNIDLDIKDTDDDYVYNDSGNFYINRSSDRI